MKPELQHQTESLNTVVQFTHQFICQINSSLVFVLQGERHQPGLCWAWSNSVPGALFHLVDFVKQLEICSASDWENIVCWHKMPTVFDICCIVRIHVCWTLPSVLSGFTHIKPCCFIPTSFMDEPLHSLTRSFAACSGLVALCPIYFTLSCAELVLIFLRILFVVIVYSCEIVNFWLKNF